MSIGVDVDGDAVMDMGVDVLGSCEKRIPRAQPSSIAWAPAWPWSMVGREWVFLSSDER